MVPECGFRDFCLKQLSQYPVSNPLTGGWGGPETKTGLLYREQMQRRKFLTLVLNGDLDRARRCIPRLKALLEEQLDELMFGDKASKLGHIDYKTGTVCIGTESVVLWTAKRMKLVDEWAGLLLQTAADGIGARDDDGVVLWEPFSV